MLTTARFSCDQKLLMNRSDRQMRNGIVKQDVELWYSRRKKKKKRNAISRREEMESTRCVCSDCGTSRTPLWRRGPSGPKVVAVVSFESLI